MKKVIVGYSEPVEYFPEEVRREFKIGEFAEEKENEEKEDAEDEEGNN